MDTREIARIVATNTARIDLPIWLRPSVSLLCKGLELNPLAPKYSPGGLFTKGRKQLSHVRCCKPFAMDIARAIRLIHETHRKICVQSHVRLSMRRRIFIHLHC